MSTRPHVLLVHAYPSIYLLDELSKDYCDISLIVPYDSPEIEHSSIINVCQCDFSDIDHIKDVSMTLHKHHTISAVLPIYEGATLLTAYIAQHLSLPGLSLTSASYGRNKLASIRKWQEDNLPTPTTVVITNTQEPWLDIEGILEYPVIVKLVDSMNSQGVIRANNSDELIDGVKSILTMLNKTNATYQEDRNRFAYGKFKHSIIAQEFCSGEEIGVDILLTENYQGAIGLFQKSNCQGPFFAESMSIYPTNLGDELEQQAIDLAISAIFSLGLTKGCAHVEIRQGRDGFKLIEAGLRPGGAFTAQASEFIYGMSTYRYQLRAYSNLPEVGIEKQKDCSVLYGGIVYKQSGILQKVEGAEVFDNMEGLLSLINLHELGDTVYTMPESAEPHNMYYLIAGNSREENLKKHLLIQDSIKLTIKEFT